jgi:PAS domain S-box-containing protein
VTIASAGVVLVGCTVLFGWAFGIESLKRILPGFVSMKANTAVGFLLAGIALWQLRIERPSVQSRGLRVAHACSSVVAAVGLLTMCQDVFGIDLHIDQLLFREASGSSGTVSPGRMAPTTALNFFLIGLGLLLLDKRPRLAQTLAVAAGGVGLLAFVGYLYGVQSLYGLASFTRMALHTSATFMVLCAGFVCSRPHKGIMHVLLSESAGGAMARRLLPFAILLPICLGGLGLIGQRTGLFDTSFGVAILVLAHVLALSTLILVNAILLRTTDEQLSETRLRLVAEKALQRSEEQLRMLHSTVPDAIVAADRDGLITIWNPGAENMFGRRRGEMLGKPLAIIMPVRFRKPHMEGLRGLVRGEVPRVIGKLVELEGLRRDGTEFPLELSLSTSGAGTEMSFFAVVRDATERKRIELEMRGKDEELLQSHKMEAVGRLAGGVAHDFNNMLTVILGGSQDLLEALNPTDPMRASVEEIRTAGQRSASLTQQLLAFSRKQVLQPRVLDLSALLLGMQDMLRRVVPENIEFLLTQEPGLGRVRIDPSQMERVFLNLAVNARDAMALGGRLSAETRNVELDVRYADDHPEVTPGAYVLLSVTDTGCGMNEETLARVFEPFFTTKGPGGNMAFN